MIKMFAKTIENNRIKKTYKCYFEEEFQIDHFFDYVKAICEHFDSPTPVILTKHIRDYIIFGTVTFTTDDFIEKVFYDKLVIESYKSV